MRSVMSKEFSTNNNETLLTVKKDIYFKNILSLQLVLKRFIRQNVQKQKQEN